MEEVDHGSRGNKIQKTVNTENMEPETEIRKMRNQSLIPKNIMNRGHNIEIPSRRENSGKSRIGNTIT